jgi:hypothetical protein
MAMEKKLMKGKTLVGTVLSLERAYSLKYTLYGGCKKHISGIKINIQDAGKNMHAVKLPTADLDYLAKNILNKKIKYSYEKYVLEEPSGTKHNWEYNIKVLEPLDSFILPTINITL